MSVSTMDVNGIVAIVTGAGRGIGRGARLAARADLAAHADEIRAADLRVMRLREPRP